MGYGRPYNHPSNRRICAVSDAALPTDPIFFSFALFQILSEEVLGGYLHFIRFPLFLQAGGLEAGLDVRLFIGSPTQHNTMTDSTGPWERRMFYMTAFLKCVAYLSVGPALIMLNKV